jgi:hypothetical protein
MISPRSTTIQYKATGLDRRTPRVRFQDKTRRPASKTKEIAMLEKGFFLVTLLIFVVSIFGQLRDLWQLDDKMSEQVERITQNLNKLEQPMNRHKGDSHED